jgi:hypothetical protein
MDGDSPTPFDYRLSCGVVWRRRDGRHWVYKKFTEYEQERAE